MMATKDDDRELGRLLSGRRQPSVLEKEAIFDSVVQEVGAKPQKARWPWWSLLSVASAAAVLFVVWPRAPELEVRGGATARLELACDPSPCRSESLLVLSVFATPDAPHFGAFGRRPDGTIIWYAPSADQPTGPTERLAFRLDAGHTPGTYRLYGLFTTKPMNRDALKAALGESLEASDDVHILERSLEVVP